MPRPRLPRAALLGAFDERGRVRATRSLGHLPTVSQFGNILVPVNGAICEDSGLLCGGVEIVRSVPRPAPLALRADPRLLTMIPVTIQRMDHVGIVVDDLAAAIEFFLELGLELRGEASVGGRSVDRVVGLEGVRAEIAMVQTPDGHGRLELTKFHSPSDQGERRLAQANTPGIRHVTFAVTDIDAVVARLRTRGAELVGELERYADSYRLCYIRGPAGIIIELAERIG